MVDYVRLIDVNALLKIYEGGFTQLANSEDEGDRRGVETCIAVLEEDPNIYIPPRFVLRNL